MNRFPSYVLMPLAALALLFPVGCNQAPTQAPTSVSNSVASGTTNGQVAPPNGQVAPTNGPVAPPNGGPAAPTYGPIVPKASHPSKVVVYTNSSPSYTLTEDFYPYDYYWPYDELVYCFGMGILPNGNLVVGDYYNSQVAVVNPTGAPNYGDSFYDSLPGLGRGQLSEPYGLAVDNQGNIYVANYGDSNIVKLSPTGSFLGSFSHNFSSVVGVTVDNLGNIYVVDSGNGNIQKFNSHFQFQKSWGHFSKPWGIATDGTNVFVADYGTEMVQKFTPNGALLGSITGGHNKGPGTFEYPYGLAADSKGNVYVSDYDMGVFKYSSTSLAFETTVTNTDPFYYGPLSVAVDPQGDVYVSDYYYYIYKFVPTIP